mmetsp:Transcript_29852/g.72659  ORF Transcript_29852/g.72659 Transcript_29852/m.72659 type:complete len:252 (+) Transcript_29852:303-1058(+)
MASTIILGSGRASITTVANLLATVTATTAVSEDAASANAPEVVVVVWPLTLLPLNVGTLPPPSSPLRSPPPTAPVPPPTAIPPPLPPPPEAEVVVMVAAAVVVVFKAAAAAASIAVVDKASVTVSRNATIGADSLIFTLGAKRSRSAFKQRSWCISPAQTSKCSPFSLTTTSTTGSARCSRASPSRSAGRSVGVDGSIAIRTTGVANVDVSAVRSSGAGSSLAKVAVFKIFKPIPPIPKTAPLGTKSTASR